MKAQIIKFKGWIIFTVLILSLFAFMAQDNLLTNLQSLEQEAIVSFQDGDLEYALAHYNQMAQISRGTGYDLYAMAGMALCYSRLGDYAQAIAIYEEVLETNPNLDSRLYNNIAEVYKKLANETGEVEVVQTGLDWLLRAIQNRTSLVEYETYQHYIYKDVGELYTLRGELQILHNLIEESEDSFELAIRYLRSAVRLAERANDEKKNDVISRSYYYMGLVSYRLLQGQQSNNVRERENQQLSSEQQELQDNALEYFEKALEFNPNFTEAEMAIQIVDPQAREQMQQELQQSTQQVINEYDNLQQQAQQNAGELSSISELTLKTILLNKINEDRARHGLGPVELDVLASTVGDNHCQSQMTHNFVGHQGLDGSNPYYRYSQTGGNDYNQQNTAGRWGYSYSQVDRDRIIEWVLDSHQRMYSEVPPNDGHRRNILDPYHTHVGIGLKYTSSSCFLTQEFLNRYCTFNDLPRTARSTQTLELSGQALSGYEIKIAAVCYEPTYTRLTPEEINQIWSYNLPSTRDYLYPRLREGLRYSDGSQGDIVINSNGSFQIPIEFTRGAGIYTILVYVIEEGNNEETFPASSISINVR